MPRLGHLKTCDQLQQKYDLSPDPKRNVGIIYPLHIFEHSDWLCKIFKPIRALETTEEWIGRGKISLKDRLQDLCLYLVTLK